MERVLGNEYSGKKNWNDFLSLQFDSTLRC